MGDITEAFENVKAFAESIKYGEVTKTTYGNGHAAILASHIFLLLEELGKHHKFMKAYYKWALSPDGTGGELFEDMVEAAENVPLEDKSDNG